MDEMTRVALRYVAEQIPVAELPMVAAELLVFGHDSPALRDLAGRGRGESAAELEELLREVFVEAGTELPGAERAERWLLGDLAARLRAGLVTPGEVEAEVWGGMAAESADAAEARFRRAARAACCADCRAGLAPAERRAWEDELYAAAVELTG
ncbi:hypothetical protein [Kitasatospora sp. NPDC088134]|uniref:hypothetical protein n=1 Tax=Kitasatospora sp. NPDC088134 TaxID=3364071 RepID=UPI00381C8ABC